MQEKTKRRYAKPSITKVMLVAQEAVLGACKYNTGLGNRGLCDPDPSCVETARS